MDPATSATRDGSSLTLAFKNFGIDFTGNSRPIPLHRGHFTQGGAPFP